MIRFLTFALLTAFASCAIAQTVGQKFTPPPGEETPEIRKLIDRAEGWIKAKETTTSGLLKDVKLVKAHEYPRFRQLIRDHADTGKTIIVTIDEPGQHLIVNGRIFDKHGKAAANALIYMYQTNSDGWYSDKAYHISGNEGDHRYARLFGYLRTDREGRYEFETIKPSGYPGSELPGHVHMFVEIGEGEDQQNIGTEIQFDDDPRLTPSMRQRSEQERAIIVKATTNSDGKLRASADLRVRN
jgi:protocatechuate 3,4-dioxygenase beta subunit